MSALTLAGPMQSLCCLFVYVYFVLRHFDYLFVNAKFKFKFCFVTTTMFLQPGMKEFNSRTRSISPFPVPSAGAYDTHDIADFSNQFGGQACQGRNRPFLAVEANIEETGSSESPTPYSFSDEGGTSSSGDFSMVNLYFPAFVYTNTI